MHRTWILLALLLLLVGCAPARSTPPDESPSPAAVSTRPVSDVPPAAAPSAPKQPAPQEPPQVGVPPTSVLLPDPSAPIPELVSACAEAYVKEQYDFWSGSTGVYGMVDGRIQMLGTPAVYDDWRVNSLEMVYSYTTLSGRPVGDYRWGPEYDWDALILYALDYRIHTTTPQEVTLAGGMILEPDGWLLPTYPNATYLVCRFMGNNVYPLFCIMVNDGIPGDAQFESDLRFCLTDAGESYRDARGKLDSLYIDGAPSMWYVAAGEPAPAAPPERAIPLTEWHKPGLGVQFSTTWRSVKLAEHHTPLDGPSLCLGGADGNFRFYLGTDYVLWQDADGVSAWRVRDAWASALPENMLVDYSEYEADERLVTLPVREGERAEDTVSRFLDAYRQHLLQLAPESLKRVLDFKSLGFSVIEASDTRISIGMSFAVRPPDGQFDRTPWWAGNSMPGEGDLAGWLTMGRGAGFEQVDGVWRCTGFYTG